MESFEPARINWTTTVFAPSRRAKLSEPLNLLPPRFEPELPINPILCPSFNQELPARVFQDPITGQLHVYVSEDPVKTEFQPTFPNISVTKRWKPNRQQQLLLERHFAAGFTRATPELYAAVRSAGTVTETQISVWLKNKLARARRTIVSSDSSSSTSNLNPSSETVSKKFKLSDTEHNVQFANEIRSMARVAMNEVSSTLEQISTSDVCLLSSELTSRKKLCCYGVGREKCIMQAFVIRLKQLGLDAYLVGETSTPSVGSKDLLIASAGPCFFNTVNAICLAAIRAEAKVIVLTSHATAPIPFADNVIRIPTSQVPSFGNPAIENNDILANGLLPLGSAYESTLWMFFESVAFLLQREIGIKEREMLNGLSNLE